MTASQLRTTFLNFFKEKGHTLIPSASLIPEHDPTVLFITAGMQPLVPFLLGEPHPGGTRLANVQKCLRTDDLFEVGDSIHNTFFEMLGNWSLGDYWKEEAISWSWEFLTKHLNFDPTRLSVSVFAGDQDAPRDEESEQIWLKLGIPKERIFFYGKKNNWWGPPGVVGPSGPDTEMFYDLIGGPLGGQEPSKNPERFVEIWNDVFMQYEKNQEGHFTPLKQRNVDTGMGLERMVMVLQEKSDIYETDLFSKMIAVLGGIKSNGDKILLDHIRASVMLISDGVEPSNKDRGYILRRLIRRAVAKNPERRGAIEGLIEDLVGAVVETYGEVYPNIVTNKNKIIQVLEEEVLRFEKTVEKGLAEFEKLGSSISGKQAFDLYQNFGFPFELTLELAKEKNLEVDKTGFEEEFKKHQEISRVGTEQKFKGGLANHSEKVIRGHTATHLLHQALRDVLGNEVHQTGSNITSERVRFDFAYERKMTEEEIKKVEDIVNQKIKEDLPVHYEIMPLERAKTVGAIGLFGEKYGEDVKIYFVGDYSKEFCGGPHVEHTSEIGRFKIVKEEGLGSGQRRIRATLE